MKKMIKKVIKKVRHGATERKGNAKIRERPIFETPWQILLEFHSQKMRRSQADLAKSLGVTPGLISHYFNGQVLPPTGERLAKLIQALHLSELEAATFREEALLANSPPEVRDLVNRLREQLAQKLQGA